MQENKQYTKPVVLVVKLEPEETISLACWRASPSSC